MIDEPRSPHRAGTLPAPEDIAGRPKRIPKKATATTQRAPRRKTEKTVIPESKEAAAARHLRNIHEAEARRGKPLSTTVTKDLPTGVVSVTVSNNRTVATQDFMPTRRRKATAVATQYEFVDVEKSLAQMPTEFLYCRDLGHNWEIVNARLTINGAEQDLKCERCTATKIRELNPRGEVIAKKAPRMPEGYGVKGMGRLTGGDRDTLRSLTAGRFFMAQKGEVEHAMRERVQVGVR